MMGLEPTTFGTTNRRSNQLSYIRHKNRGDYRLLFDVFQTRGQFSAIMPAVAKAIAPKKNAHSRLLRSLSLECIFSAIRI
jgi:hypothetical protein